MYTTIIFDLDDTLTDDCANMKEAFKTVLKYRQEEYTDAKFELFYKIDKETWKKVSRGEIITPYENNIEKKAEYLRAGRFLKYFENKIDYNEAVHINKIYTDGMKRKVVAREGATDIIKYLYNKKYNLVIATNGPTVPLNTKLEKLKIKEYLKTVFSAEEVGFVKPHPKFYKDLLDKCENVPKENVLFIGDELEKDIKGSIENNIDTCWCNYYNKNNNTKYIPKYEIHKLEELKQIL